MFCEAFDRDDSFMHAYASSRVFASSFSYKTKKKIIITHSNQILIYIQQFGILNTKRDILKLWCSGLVEEMCSGADHYNKMPSSL